MSTPNTVQEARKQMQLLRLERKGKKGYAKFYASQPFQLARARENTERYEAHNTLATASNTLAIAEITGEGLGAAREAHTLASLVVERLNINPRTHPNTHTISGANLSGARL